jgi:hypothetical protein
MRRSTAILLAGSGLSIVIGGGAYLIERQRSQALDAAIERCHAESIASKDYKELHFQMDCSPADLFLDDPPFVDVQAEVVGAEAKQFQSRLWLQGALVLFGISALPWLWYTLLRRIAELRAAVSGKPPNG